jgi:hypothetical protein
MRKLSAQLVGLGFVFMIGIEFYLLFLLCMKISNYT